jgi:glycopeptide antibiotics resistance protein
METNSLWNERILYSITVIGLIFLGLASRKYSQSLPLFIANNAGDAIWAMMVYFGFRFLIPRKRKLNALLLSLLSSFAIEFSQLYQAVWINQIRATTLGALILGKGFLLVDLLRYTVGILIAFVLDSAIKK